MRLGKESRRQNERERREKEGEKGEQNWRKNEKKRIDEEMKGKRTTDKRSAAAGIGSDEVELKEKEMDE